MGVLAEWFVQLGTKGKMKTEQDIDSVKGKLEKAGIAAGGFLKTLGSIALGGVAGVLSAGSGLAAMGIGLAVAGVKGSNEWDRFTKVIDRLSQHFGALLLPIIERVADAMDDWLEKSAGRFGAMQDAIERIAEVGLVQFRDNLESIGIILDKVIIPAMLALAEVAERLEKMGVFQALRDITGSKSLAAGLQGLPSAAGGSLRLPSRPGQFESIDSAFKRINIAAVNIGPSAAERAAKAAERIAARLDGAAVPAARKAMEPNPLGP